MEVESLAGLTAAFEGWRRKKRHAREAVPGDLLDRARRAIGVHGLGPVARATKVDRMKLGGRGRHGNSSARPTAHAPMFSRVELSASPTTARPFAEVEMPTGMKVRLFASTDEAVQLLWSLCGVGGAR